MFSETSCSVLFSCKMRKFVTRQPCWDQLRKYQAPPTSRSTANRNALSLKWPVIGQSLPSRARFSKAWKQSHEEVQKSSFLSEHLNYNMLKGYYGIFAQWCQNILPTEALKKVRKALLFSSLSPASSYSWVSESLCFAVVVKLNCRSQWVPHTESHTASH